MADVIKRGEAMSFRQLSKLARAVGYKASFETVRRDVREMGSRRALGPNLLGETADHPQSCQNQTIQREGRAAGICRKVVTPQIRRIPNR